jgi:hypothetical protein
MNIAELDKVEVRREKLDVRLVNKRVKVQKKNLKETLRCIMIALSVC